MLLNHPVIYKSIKRQTILRLVAQMHVELQGKRFKMLLPTKKNCEVRNTLTEQSASHAFEENQ